MVQEGNDALPRCDLCGMHMTEGRVINHQGTQRYSRNTQMRWRRRDVTISSQCVEASFSLTGEDEVECIEVMETFTYLVLILDRSDNDCAAVLRNVGKSRQVWSQIGKLLKR